MEITLIIVGGIVLVSVLGVVSDLMKKAMETKKPAPLPDETVRALTQRIAALEEERDRSAVTVRKLEEDVGFMQRLLEKK